MGWHQGLQTSCSQSEAIYMTHISAHLGYRSNAECRTAPAITLSVQCLMLNADVRKGRGGGFGQIQTLVDRGNGVGKRVIFADVRYG